MKYMLMMIGTSQNFEAMGSWTPEEIRAHIQFMTDVNERLAANGEFVTAEGLTPPRETKIVRADADGSAVVTDGPFPETKEFLAGYWIVQTDTLDRAVEIAAMVSTAPGRGGEPMNIPIELREVGEAPDL